jgi:hypothetical protein
LPEAAFAAAAKPASPIADLQLQEGGVLVGQLVTPQNSAITGAEVGLRNGPQRLFATKTNEGGYFAFGGLRNGVYQVETPKGPLSYRVWTKQTAPPAAQPGALIVVGDKAVLGQQTVPGGPVVRFLTNPWVIAAMVATAVAVPVAIHNAQRDRASP